MCKISETWYLMKKKIFFSFNIIRHIRDFGEERRTSNLVTLLNFPIFILFFISTDNILEAKHCKSCFASHKNIIILLLVQKKNALIEKEKTA